MILTSTAIKYTAAGIAVVAVPVVAVMSEGMLTAVLVAIPAILTVIGVIVVNIINALKATVDKSAQQSEKNSEQIAEVKKTADKIEGHVNSAAAAAAAKILGLENEIRLMREALASNIQAAALLAQSKAAGEAMPRGPAASAPISVVVENSPHDPVPTVVLKKP